MKIENQVVSLEPAKQMRDAGYPQNDSWYIWAYDLIGIKHRLLPRESVGNHPQDYAAPTVAELGEKLPKCTGNICYHTFGDADGYWYAWETDNGIYDVEGNNIKANTEADARAKMWLYLKDKGLL